jgi:prepilin-type N-terminal cleavage/methylation domain-containing protein
MAEGFSLIELSIVLLIVALLGSGLFGSIASQRSLGEVSEARLQLDTAHESLLGFAIRYGRLPCPAAPTLRNTENLAGLEDCTRQHGVLPWADLALPETDPWGRRMTYYASNRFSGALPVGANASFTLDTDGNANIQDGQTKVIASNLSAVLVSHGPRGDGGYLPSGARLPIGSGDENENTDADLTFVERLPNENFDDLLIWVIPGILKNRMVSAGRLP